MASFSVRFLDHTQRRTTVVGLLWTTDQLSQRPLPDGSQHLQQTDIHAPGGIRTHDLSRRAAADLRLRTRCYWDRLYVQMCVYIYIFEDTRAEPL